MQLTKHWIGKEEFKGRAKLLQSQTHKRSFFVFIGGLFANFFSALMCKRISTEEKLGPIDRGFYSLPFSVFILLPYRRLKL